MKAYVIALTLFASIPYAFGEEAEKAKDRIGEGKAVVAADEKEGFKLSPKAQKNLDLTLAGVSSKSLTVPLGSLVRFQDFFAIYRMRDGWFRLVEIEPIIHGQKASFSSKDIKIGDQVVVGNGGLLRVVELDVFGPEADACAD